MTIQQHFRLKSLFGDAIKAVNKNEVADCIVCFKEVALSKLRQHIAKRILLKELNNNAKTSQLWFLWLPQLFCFN